MRFWLLRFPSSPLLHCAYAQTAPIFINSISSEDRKMSSFSNGYADCRCGGSTHACLPSNSFPFFSNAAAAVPLTLFPPKWFWRSALRAINPNGDRRMETVFVKTVSTGSSSVVVCVSYSVSDLSSSPSERASKRAE